MDLMLVTGVTQQLHEDIPNFQKHQFVIQAEQFLQNGTDPLVYYTAVSKNLLQVPGVELQSAMELLDSIEMLIVNQAASLLAEAGAKRKGGDTKAIKPADIYRKYHVVLRTIYRRNGETALFAQELLGDIYLEQTLSNNDLENPEYIDPYTGTAVFDDIQMFEKALPDRHVPGLDELLKFIAMVPEGDGFDGTAKILPVSGHQREIQRAAERCRIDLGWTDVEVNAFIKANTVGVSMLEEDEEPEDDRGFTPPPLIKDFELDHQTISNSWPVIKAFNAARSDIFKFMKERVPVEKNGLIKFEPRVKTDWLERFHDLFHKHDAFITMIDTIEQAADNPATAAVLYLRVSGEYGVMPSDIERIKLIGPSATLPEFVEMFFDDLVELLADGASFPTSESAAYRKIDTSDDQYIQSLTATMPVKDPNPVKTVSWNLGLMMAVIGGATWNEAEDAAWANWRSEMNADAAEAYNAVINKGGDRKHAMTAFWKRCPSDIPRPQSKIKTIAGNKAGLVLEGGRVITWGIAKVKILNNELDLSGDIKPRLLAKLVELSIGREVWSLLK